MTRTELILSILIMVAGTQLTRFLPFLCFPPGRKIPDYLRYLGSALPGAIMGMLVIYCLKDVSFTTPPFALPTVAALAVIVVLHLWKHNTFLSLAFGTAVYMICIRLG